MTQVTQLPIALDETIVHAARAEVSAVGLRRATMTSIARRAGLSRATLHRRAQSTDALVMEALVTEYSRVLAAAQARAATIAREHQRAHLVALAQEVVDTLGADPLLTTILREDAEILLTYVVERLGRSQEIILRLLAAAIVQGQADGSVREGDPEVIALAMVQALTPFVIGRSIMLARAPHEHWQREVGILVDAYLRPQ